MYFHVGLVNVTGGSLPGKLYFIFIYLFFIFCFSEQRVPVMIIIVQIKLTVDGALPSLPAEFAPSPMLAPQTIYSTTFLYTLFEYATPIS